MVKKFVLQWATFIMILLISFSSTNHPITGGYIYELRDQAINVMQEEDPLYMEIISKQKDYEIEPKDAIVDKVWKAIPGYNGAKVDVQASYEAMKSSGQFNEEKLIYQQMEPEVTLKDLPPSPIYRGNKEKPMVALMVNVAWGNDYLTDILKTMNELNTHATFFLDGSWVRNNPKLAKMIVEEGHEIGNHAYSHPNMKNLTRNRIVEQISKTNDVIKTVTGEKTNWFAPPSGSYRQEVVDVASELGMYTVLWTVDTVDWKKPNPIEMGQRVIQKTDPGSLILMHPTSATAKGLEAMIVGIKEKGLRLGTLSETLSETRIQFDH